MLFNGKSNYPKNTDNYKYTQNIINQYHAYDEPLAEIQKQIDSINALIENPKTAITETITAKKDIKSLQETYEELIVSRDAIDYDIQNLRHHTGELKIIPDQVANYEAKKMLDALMAFMEHHKKYKESFNDAKENIAIPLFNQLFSDFPPLKEAGSFIEYDPHYAYPDNFDNIAENVARGINHLQNQTKQYDN